MGPYTLRFKKCDGNWVDPGKTKMALAIRL